MNKNKLILITVLLFSVLTCIAQNGQRSKTLYGIKAGLVFTNVSSKDASGNKITGNNYKTGINAGFYADVPLGKNFFFEPGLMFSNKGSVNRESSPGKITISTGYIEVPLNFVLKAPSKNGNFLVGLGPYVAYGISGNVKEVSGGYKETTIKYATKSSINFNYSKNKYYLTPFDGGIGLLVGFESKAGIIFHLNGQFGVVNEAVKINGVNFNLSSYKNYGFGFSAGYRF